MTFPFRHRLSLVERAFWLALALILGLAISAHAQSHHKKPSHSSRTLRTTADDEFVRNHGTGVRFGSELAAARSGHLFSALELGVYHQHKLGDVGSVQVEANYFRAPATATSLATRGLCIPALLVLNPFDNVGFHLGPQLRWQMAAAGPREANLPAVRSLTTELAVGGEARVWRGRVGVRYAAPLELLADLPAYADRFGDAWHGGNLQVYVGFDVFE